MSIYEFTLILTADPNQEEADRLYSISLMMELLPQLRGCPKFIFTVRPFRLESAIVSALLEVRKAGFDAIRVHINPKAMLGSNRHYRFTGARY